VVLLCPQKIDISLKSRMYFWRHVQFLVVQVT